ncbi:BZ3501_MvSof-1269-A2-R1_Chr12-1g03325 [Microbotryum saponariae]|nr:BZ3501_MvSof-1269-A2-R1_Chr12-1g03325 [Microbotryum saponariae]
MTGAILIDPFAVILLYFLEYILVSCYLQGPTTGPYTKLPIASFTVNDVIVATLRCVLGKLLYTADKFSAEVYGPVVFKIMDHCYDGSYTSITGVSSQCVWTSVAAWVGHKELRRLMEARLRPPLKRLRSDLPNLCS